MSHVPAFYINLDRVPDRAAFMDRVLAEAGLDAAQRFPAADAKDGVDLPGYRPRAWGEYWTLKPSEQACFESHRRIWARMVEEGVPVAAVFEDDLIPAGDLGQAVARLAGAAEAFDLVKLDGVPGTRRLGPLSELGGVDVRPLVEPLPSSAAYIVSARGAACLLDWAQNHSDHVDDFITRSRPGYRAFQLVPALGVQAAFVDPARTTGLPPTVATSEREAAPEINQDYDKGPVPYRLMKELRRAARRIRRQAWGDRALIGAGGHIGEIPLAPELGGYGSPP